MKKLMLIGTLFLTACSSFNPKPENLKESKSCMVWQKDMLGVIVAREVVEEKAKQQSTCWVMNMFLCSYINYTFRPGTTEILSDIGDKDKAIGKLDTKANQISINRSGVDVDPATIKNGRIEYMLQGPLGPKTARTVEYSPSCTVRQAALGAASFM